MRRRRVVSASLTTLACVIALCGAPTAQSDVSSAEVLRVKVDGSAEAVWGSCPFQVPPTAPLTCHETLVLVFREARAEGGGSVAPPKTPWRIFIFDHTLTFPSTDIENVPPISTDERFGEAIPLSVDFDQQHLSFANVTAQVPMSDGSTWDFRANWVAVTDRTVYGNDGPQNGFEGIPRHVVDRCATSTNNAHQKIRYASMTGTLNGNPIHSYTEPEMIINYGLTIGNFVYVNVSHGGAGCP